MIMAMVSVFNCLTRSGLFVDFELMDLWAVWHFEGIVGIVGTARDEMHVFGGHDGNTV